MRSVNLRRLTPFIACAVSQFGLGAVHVWAQAPRPAATPHLSSAVSAVATRRTGVISIDGNLNEADWSKATPITTFRQSQPAEGNPATLRTEIRILYDDQALYIGARLSDPLGANGVRAPRARRDQLLEGNGNNGSFNSLTSDKLVVILDPYHNHVDEALFEVNPAGVRGESFNGDDSWDPIWEAAARVDSAGWTAEMRIPLSQLRFSREEVQHWGMQILRYVDRLNERDMWSFRRLNESGGPAFYGHLDGMTIAKQPRQLEIMPYVVARAQYKAAAAGDPYHTGTDRRANIGGDVKYLLTTNLTLDATVNPDFGQVEVDPAVLNLSAFETYYAEKRPFFVAGSSAFNFGGSSCFFCTNFSSLDVFYSRRIGRPPQLSNYVGGQSVYADTPDNSAILGAAKITGRTSSGYTVGVLDAVTNRETARFFSSSAVPESRQVVEPLANYFVARVNKDFNQGGSTIGVIATSTARQLGSDSVVTNRLRSGALALGVDWYHSWSRRDYSWQGSVVASDITGSPAAISLVEQSSAHYFQRPDRQSVDGGFFGTRYDTLATALRGYGLYTRLAKQNGNWLWELAQNWRSPGYEVNDLSFLDRASYRWMGGNVARQWTVPSSWYRNIFASTGLEQEFNWDGLRTSEDVSAYYGMEFPNYWRLRTFFIHQFTTDDDRLTRGGPVTKRAGYNFGHLQVSTDPRRRAVFDVTVRGGRGTDEPLTKLQFQPSVALKPISSVYIQLSPSFSTSDDPAQYVTAVRDPAAAGFGGTRYVFALIRTRTLSLETRVNWTFTPNLTLQLYAQPFFASGDYGQFREFAAPRALKKLVYGRDVGTIARNATTGTYTVDPDGSGPAAPFRFADPNFSARSLRGTAVLRWEYRPGSTMYFAWTQQRSGQGIDGRLDFSRDQAALWRDPADNVFLVKVNYWLGR